MGNDLTSTPNLWVLDTAGMLSTTPVWVRKILYVPNAASDDILLKEWDPETALAAGTKYIQTGSIASNNQLTSTGNLPSTIVDGSVFRITASSGAAANIDYHVVETAGDNDKIVVHDDDWTDESSKIYSWTTYLTHPAMVYKAGASDESPIRDSWSPPKRFNNLTLETIDGGTLYVYLY